MATQRTPINEPTNSRSRTKVRGTRTATRRSHQQPTSSRHPSPGRLVSVSRAAVLALAIWLVAAGATNDYQPTRGARSDQTIPAAQHELTDHEIQRFNNRVEADRRQVESWQLEQQEIEQSEEREVQRFNNRVEADRRQVESWQLEQQEIEQSEEREVQRFNNRAEADRRQVGKQRGE